MYSAKRRNLNAFSQGLGAAGPSGVVTTAAATMSRPKESGGAYQRLGASNVHRLHENKDDEDDTNTWNGNSTQQQ